MIVVTPYFNCLVKISDFEHFDNNNKPFCVGSTVCVSKRHFDMGSPIVVFVFQIKTRDEGGANNIELQAI